MAVIRVSQSTVKRGLEKANSAAAGITQIGRFDSIASSTVGAGGSASIVFSPIPQTYSHLQIRYLVASSVADNNVAIRFNGDTNANYTIHELTGGGAATASSGGLAAVGFARIGYWQSGTLSFPYVGVVDILDYASSSKTTVIRCFNGTDTNSAGNVRLISGMWTSTAAVTSITVYTVQQNLPQYSTVALYGIRG